MPRSTRCLWPQAGEERKIGGKAANPKILYCSNFPDVFGCHTGGLVFSSKTFPAQLLNPDGMDV